MTSTCGARRLPWTASPEEIFDAWPADRALAALWSGPATGAGQGGPNRWSRWTVFAEPVSTLRAGAAEALQALDTIAQQSQPAPASDDRDLPPFTGGWIGWMAYELGHVLEPASRGLAAGTSPPTAPDGWPLMEWHRCPAAYVHDHWTGAWWAVGKEDAQARLSVPTGSSIDSISRSFRLGTMTSSTGRETYKSAVERVIGHIEAGDVFQVNLAHRFRGAFEGSARRLFRHLASKAGPWFGAYIEHAAASEGEVRRIIASISPELFLHKEAPASVGGASEGGGMVTTRPIKGTRPARGSELELWESDKDRAELTMIVDLMRNDLGRVCRVGSVAVDELRRIERHGSTAETGVLHGVATVQGKLRQGVTMAELLRATFPPGSITGAPKIRAMQIIDDLEPVGRGPYCGSIGFVSDSGHAAFNVAIRTACIAGPAGSARDEIRPGGRLDYHVGAGIVADSEPAAEWQETLDKAATILSVAEPSNPLAHTGGRG